MAGLWTNNWKAVKNAFLCGEFIPGMSAPVNTGGAAVVTQREDGSGSVDDRGPRFFTSPMGAYYATAALPGNNAAGSFIRVGTGSAAPAAADYNLAATAADVSYLSAIKERPSYNAAAGTVSCTVKLTLQNTADAAQTITEWGIFSAGNYLTCGQCLLYRALLDSPVTLQPNQSATLTLTLSVTLTDLAS